ncbi:schlafen-like protein 1 [Melanotaenia boesemani]|uniref:schlafen-like protein 1 n=1 Tax=Melanotaenia boesemani TaxID=1250792 RepID=UPI001C03EF31|nr:schlafen-like protein 1 [Melanotaenia boesemani]XP_041823236.1 schlafen-like protein 1 [Melanotaenia boesemani]
MKKNNRSFRGAKRKNRKRRWRGSATSSRHSQILQAHSQTGQHQGIPVQLVSEQDIRSCRSLCYGAYIGNESRTLEFKQGEGAYLQEFFYRHVCVYGCAFLNCVGGCLLVGVHDSGVVHGVKLSHEMEDEVRLHMDDAIKTFQPALLPCNYTLDFLPVIKHGQQRRWLKVVRLTFTPPPAVEPILFQSGSGEVFIKRDGSVQGPLSVSSIIEWNKLMWGSKVKQLEQCVYQARCEAGCFSWFTDPQHHIVASLPTKARRTNSVEMRLRSSLKLTAGALQPDSRPGPSISCLNINRRHST